MRTAILNIMVKAVMKASRSLIRDFGEIENLQVSRKSINDFVSIADYRSEKILCNELQKARPDYGIIREENQEIIGKDLRYKWYIDPLDGTKNFLHSIPIFAVSVALEKEKNIIAAVVCNPILDELYTAERGRGSFLNDRRLRVSGRTDSCDMLFGSGLTLHGRKNNKSSLQEINYIAPKVSGIRRSGSVVTDLAWVASGRLDGYWEHDLNAWDIASGILLIKEAGGYISNIYGDKKNILISNNILAGNESGYNHLLELLAQSKK